MARTKTSKTDAAQAVKKVKKVKSKSVSKSASKATKKVSKKSTKKETKPVVEEKPVETPVVQETKPVETPVVEETKPEVPELDVDARFSELLSSLSNVSALLKTLSSETKTLQKDIQKRMKTLSKNQKKKKSKGEKSNSGFNKPTKISNELAAFMGQESESEVPRSDVTKFICNYIKTNNLQNAENKRQIILDDALTKLLNPSETLVKGKEPSYFNLQRMLKPHFV